MRYGIARILYRLRFPRAGRFTSCDFRPRFDGHLHSAWIAISLRSTAEDTRELASRKYRSVVLWLRRIRWCFRTGDRINVVVGFPMTVKKGGGQILKGWIPANRLGDVGSGFAASDSEQLGGSCTEMENWPYGIFMAKKPA